MKVEIEIENGEGLHVLVFDGHVESLERRERVLDLVVAAWNLEVAVKALVEAEAIERENRR